MCSDVYCLLSVVSFTLRSLGSGIVSFVNSVLLLWKTLCRLLASTEKNNFIFWLEIIQDTRYM